MTDFPQDLEQLKQELYAKIQATQKPERPLSDLDLLKRSELPIYEAHKNLRHQTERQWQQSPVQGAIPLPRNAQEQLDQRCPCIGKPLAECNCEPDPNPELAEVGESLKSAAPWLENAYCLMNSNKFDKRYYDLYMAVCDAMNACRDALDRLEDEPDEE